MAKVYYGSNEIFNKFVGSSYFAVLTTELEQETINFLNATGITNGGVREALNTLVFSLKTESLWDKMDMIYPFVADDTNSLATQFGYNLKNTSSFNPTFINGVNGDLDGYLSDSATTKYIRTGYIPSQSRANNQIHVSIYTTNPGVPGNAIDWGAIGGSPQSYSYLVTGRSLNESGPGETTKLVALRTNTLDSVNSVSQSGYSIGVYSGSFTAYYLNDEEIIYEPNDPPTGSLATLQAFFGAWNNGNNPQYITNKKYQFLSVGDLIPSSSISTLNTIVQTFQESIDSALGTTRAV